MSSDGSHLFGCHGSTGEPWVGDQASQNISPGKKRNSTIGSISGMSTTHGHSLTTHVTTTRVYPYSTPCSHYSVCFVALWGEAAPKKCWSREKEKKWKEQPWPPSVHSLVFVFLWMSQGRDFFFFSWGRHQSCTCATSASGLVATLQLGCFCIGSSLIITLNMLLHTFLLPLVYCTYCVASEAFSIEAA